MTYTEEGWLQGLDRFDAANQLERLQISHALIEDVIGGISQSIQQSWFGLGLVEYTSEPWACLFYRGFYPETDTVENYLVEDYKTMWLVSGAEMLDYWGRTCPSMLELHELPWNLTIG